MEVFGQFKHRDHPELVQARKVLAEHVSALVGAGETDEQRLVVAGLAHLKFLERQTSRSSESRPSER
jgi:hypothetical protein